MWVSAMMVLDGDVVVRDGDDGGQHGSVQK